MATPVSRVEIPLLNLQLEISALNKKILAVAIASIVLFGVQFALSLPITFAATFFITALTYFAERNQPVTNDWFNVDFDKKQFLLLTTLLILRPFILQIIFSSLGIPLPEMPQVEIAEAIFNHPWKFVPLATLIAPIAEEILFRGFLLERLENVAGFLSRHVIELSETTQQTISDVAQAVIFGSLHLKRTIEESSRLPVFLAISLFGYLMSTAKREEKTLISPIGIHSANNMGAVIYVFMTHKQVPS